MEEKKQENQFSGMTREEIILEAKKQILHSAVLALAALIVIGVACYAWFASNKNVTAKAGSVSVAQNGFELASVGAEGVFDGQIPTDFTVPAGEAWTSPKNEPGTYTAGQQAILWRMSDESHLGNQKKGAGGSEAGGGISPGSGGKLTFYVIPQRDGLLKLAFHLNVIPLSSAKGALSESEAAWKLIQGHLLFSHSTVDADGKTATDEKNNLVMELVDFENKSFTLNFGEVKKAGAPIPVTLSWTWPYVLEDARADTTVAAWMSNGENAGYFYYHDPGKTGQNTVNISGVTEKNLSDWFNNADQKIGDDIDAIILQLTAVME
ncbi:MAG: hypothetical protein SPC78_08165 [Candidatus Faecousia sp.]|nr:hypothetical protein [Candidatus Faecousia sp.]